jgi:lysophospholipase L1-like esterase
MTLWWGEERRGFEPALLLGVCFVLLGLVLVVFRQEVVRGCIVSAAGAVIYVTADRTSRPPSNRSETTRPLLICLGDSLTHGHCSASVVDRIVPTLKSRSGKDVKLGVVNAGQNNICSWTIYHKRMEAVLQYDPDYVLVMIGSNDVCSIYNKWWSVQRECMWQLPERPSLDGLETNVHGIVTTLLHHSPRLQVGLCTLPPMGEVFDQPTNQVVRQANVVISRIADSMGDRCTLVPVYGSLEQSIRSSCSELGAWKPPADYFLPLSIVMGMLHHVGGFSWNTLSRLLGNSVLSDSLHLNERGATVVATAVADWLLSKGISPDSKASKKTR